MVCAFVWKEDYDVKVGMHRIIMLSKEIHKNIKHNQDGNKAIVMRILFTNTSCHPIGWILYCFIKK